MILSQYRTKLSIWHQAPVSKNSLFLHLVTGCTPFKCHAQLTISQSFWVSTVENCYFAEFCCKSGKKLPLEAYWSLKQRDPHPQEQNINCLPELSCWNHQIFCVLLVFTIKITCLGFFFLKRREAFYEAAEKIGAKGNSNLKQNGNHVR